MSEVTVLGRVKIACFNVRSDKPSSYNVFNNQERQAKTRGGSEECKNKPNAYFHGDLSFALRNHVDIFFIFIFTFFSLSLSFFLYKDKSLSGGDLWDKLVPNQPNQPCVRLHRSRFGISNFYNYYCSAETSFTEKSSNSLNVYLYSCL